MHAERPVHPPSSPPTADFPLSLAWAAGPPAVRVLPTQAPPPRGPGPARSWAGQTHETGRPAPSPSSRSLSAVQTRGRAALGLTGQPPVVRGLVAPSAPAMAHLPRLPVLGPAI